MTITAPKNTQFFFNALEGDISFNLEGQGHVVISNSPAVIALWNATVDSIWKKRQSYNGGEFSDYEREFEYSKAMKQAAQHISKRVLSGCNHSWVSLNEHGY